MKAKHIVSIVGVAGALVMAYRYAKSCESVIEIGIHFHASPVDFGAPPPRFQPPFDDDFVDKSPWRASSLRYHEDLNGNSRDSDAAQARIKAWGKKMAAADELASVGQYQKAIAEYQGLNRAGAGNTGFLVRRISLLRSLDGTMLSASTKSLLAATTLGSKRPLPELSSLTLSLRPYAAYEQASRAFDAEQYPSAADLYRACGKQFPQSPLADAALMMAARSNLQVDTVNGLDQPRDDLQTLISQYPHSRFKSSALGWKARIAVLQQKFADAVFLYKLQLGSNLNHDQRLNALTSLVRCYTNLNRADMTAATWIRIFGNAVALDDATYAANKFRATLSRLSPAESGKFADDIKVDPTLLANYVQLRLEMTRTTKKERAEIARIAKACPNASPKLLARLAQVSYSDSGLANCKAFATRAAQGASYGSEEWGIAHYLLGTMANRNGQRKTAEREYKLVASAGPKNYLAVGAHEALVLLYDREGRHDLALDELYWLSNWSQKTKGYPEFTYDIAYMLDAKMSPREIERYLATRGSGGHRQLLRYTIGLRYLRQNKFNLAERSLGSIPKKLRQLMAHTGLDDPAFDTGPIQDPLQTAKDLAQLTYEADVSRGPSAKAKGLLQLASYYYKRRTLLLYNAPLWRGYRASAIGFSWNPQTASRADNLALTKHHLEHECLQHTVDICALILAKYPKTDSAPLAAYREACAEERLSNFNPWWRWMGAREGLLERAIAHMNLVASRYSKSPVASEAGDYGNVFSQELASRKTYETKFKESDVFGGWMGYFAY